MTKIVIQPTPIQPTPSQPPATLIQLPAGRLNAANAEKVKQELLPVLASETTYIILDLSLLTSVDSLGIGLLLSTLKSCIQAGCHLKLCGLQAEARLPFELLNLNNLFEFFDSVEVAMTTCLSQPEADF